MATFSINPLLRRWLAGMLAVLIGLGPVATPAYAALTNLADQPLSVTNQAKPNVVLTVDDSTSMLYDFLPAYVVGNYCRSITGLMSAPCGFGGSPANVGPGGHYVSVQYVWEQVNLPFSTYATGYDPSGPGAGCNLLAVPPSCSSGIDPGPLPGLATYPATSGSPSAGLPYEYWLLWPAPGHNAALNHLYYNPELTYQPAVYSDGTSYDQMDAAHTTNWTQVPADPWAVPVQYVDLTASVTVGQWCNSDWTQGNDDSGNPFATNPAYCRTNGVVAAAASGAPAATGDYMYPWAPAGITPNNYTSKVDMSTISTTSIPPTNATVKAAWIAAQDPKYFYQTDNVLWCDIASPEWPDTTTNLLPQTCDMSGPAPTCNGFRSVGTCSATGSGNCNGYTAGTCNTGTGVCAGYTAGACNTGNGVCAGNVAGACSTGNGNCSSTAGTCNTANGNCNSTLGTCNTGNGVCAGAVAGTCNLTNGVCSGGNGTCNTANGNCAGYVTGACSAGQVGSCGAPTSCTSSRETCVAGTAASCGGITGQTCGGAVQKTCNDVAQVCNGALGAQTCINIVAIPPDPSTCTSAWVPLGCNTNPDPEGTCNYQTTCPPPTYQGTCSKQPTNVCTTDTDCPYIYGTCSTQTTKQCSTNSDCTGLKYCQGSTTVCAVNSDCGFVAGSGTCSKDGLACTVSTDCASTGTCNYQNTASVPSGVCSSNAGCKPFPNFCQTTTGITGCTVGANSAACPVIPNSGTCQYANTSGGSCTTTADCSSKCQNAGKLGTVCASNAACNVTGSCSAGLPNTTTCTQASDCNKNGACTTGTSTGAACTANGANATCGPIDKCSAGLPNTTTCTTAAQCNTNGTCTTGINTGTACSGSGVNAACGPIDKCSAGLPNTTTCTANAQCNAPGACTTGANTGNPCATNGVSVTCGVVNKCTVGKTGLTCTVNADCNTNGTCTTGINTGTVCTTPGVNAVCGAIDKCSAGLPNTTTCTTNAQCNTTGACTTGTNIGTACTTPGVNAACGAIDKCSAGKPATTTCTTAAQCNVTGTCSTGPNFGNACTTNGANATCGAVNKCTAGLPGTVACTANGQCTVNGACTSGVNTGAPCTANGSNAACGVVNQCSAGNVGAACTTNATCTVNGICTTGNSGASCTANGPTDPECALPNGFCSNYSGNTQACTVANAATQCAGTTGVCSSNSSQTCTDASVCAQFGKCTLTGAVCTTATVLTDCPSQPGPKQPLNATCDDKTAVSGITLLADANTNGVVCRRNNHTYPDGAAGQVTYPSGRFTSPVVGEAVAGAGCHTTNRYTSIPRHYWKTSVEWCSSSNTTAGDEWNGYGLAGTCQPATDSTFIYPRFYQFGVTTAAAAYGDNYGNPAFQREDLDLTKEATATYTHTWTDINGTVQTVTRTFDQEMTNYANWFAYYRTRILAVKTVTSLAFLGVTLGIYNVDDTLRIGLHTLSNGAANSSGVTDPSTFVDVQDFTLAQKAAWATQLFAISIPLNFETPSLNAVMRIGEYFNNYKNCCSGQLLGATDPIILSCQKNYHMFFTDGFTNQPSLPPFLVGDVDNTVPALPDPVVGLTAGSPWPAPFRENPTPASDSASDYITYYWATDLRPGNGALAIDNVPTNGTDPAGWQHLNFAAMSLGTQGKLPNANQSVTESQLAQGTLQWPPVVPTVNKPDISGVDDLWHAAINGRGRFVNAQSADDLKLGMGQILQDILNQGGSRAGAGFGSSSLAVNNFVYKASFDPGWGGEVIKEQLDPTTGAVVQDVWDASTQLSLQLQIVNVGDTPWFTNRRIVTLNDVTNKAMPFLWGNLSPAQQDSLAPGTPTRGQQVLEFLRGNPTLEGAQTGQFRVRPKVLGQENFLGDIVDSQTVYVGPPSEPYLDANDPGYAAFASAQSGRAAMIYVGANDGMLHAFYDVSNNPAGAVGGNEAWAFIPKDIYRGDSTGLGALSLQDGALPPFKHHFYVDSTPRVVDVADSGGAWHSLLVGGLGKGGMSYYGIDVTNPASVTDETSAANNVLWEATDADMGYTYGRPMIAKTHATASPFYAGEWVVIVPSGFNNPSGIGKIFIFDAMTGAPLKTLTTGFGNSGSPSGLAYIAGYTTDYRNQLVEQIYGGDLYGNFWRFDMSSSNPNDWDSSTNIVKLAYLTDPGGAAQPVTTPPQIEVDISNGIDRWVFVGTGRLLDDTDLTDPAIANQIQTMYAIRDGTEAAPITPLPATIQPRADMVPIVNQLSGLTSKPDIGWYDDLPAGQRMVTPPQAAIAIVAYVGTSPQTDPCLTGQPATLYVRQFSNGESLLTDAGGNAVSEIDLPEGAVGLDIEELGSGTADTGQSNLDIRVAVTSATTGDIAFYKVTLPQTFYNHRMSWRLLGQ